MLKRSKFQILFSVTLSEEDLQVSRTTQDGIYIAKGDRLPSKDILIHAGHRPDLVVLMNSYKTVICRVNPNVTEILDD